MPSERCHVCKNNPATTVCDRCKRRICKECYRTVTKGAVSAQRRESIECAQCEFDPEPL